MSEPLPLSQVLAEEYVRLHGSLPADALQQLQEQVPPEPDAGKRRALEKDLETRKLKALYAAIHELETPRTALCFSGGGIRSATFALGITQGLARWGLLPQFDFLSTVSGGGYIGSWLSSYIRRNPGGVADVSATLNGTPPAVRNPLEPEVEPLRWLRRFSNYVTPKLGLFSGDTWAGAGSYLRNLLLNWLVFVPFLLSMLALPRLGVALLRAEAANAYLTTVYAVVAGLLILYGTAVVAFERPVSYRDPGSFTNGKFLLHVLLPYFIASGLLALTWATLTAPVTAAKPVSTSLALKWWQVYAGFAVISLLNAGVYMVRFARDAKKHRRGNIRHDADVGEYTLAKFVTEILAALVSSAVAAALLHVAATQLFDNPTESWQPPNLEAWKAIPPALPTANAEIYLCLAVPLVLGILFLQSAIFVAGVSWYNEEYDREWWGRAAGWVLAAALVWMVGTAITVYGPVAIYEGPRLFAALTGGTGLFAILLGKSGKTSASPKESDEKASPTTTGLKLSLGLIAPIFVVCILALLSLTTSKVLLSIPSIAERIKPENHIKNGDLRLAQYSSYQIKIEEELNVGKRTQETVRLPAVEKDKLDALLHLWTIDDTQLLEGLILVFGPLLFSYLVSFFVGVNQFSLHSLYRNRLIRGYLGASRFSRHPNLFSGFDPNDNLPMYRLRPEMFWATGFRNIGTLGGLLAKDARLKGYLKEPTVEALRVAAANPNSPDDAAHAGDLLSYDLNRALDEMEPKANPPFVTKAVQNRREIEADYGTYIIGMETHQRPLHVINTTLNLVGGDELAWQERKGETFAVSPHHTGNYLLGYRETSHFGGPDGVTLGTAVAISGAAASPNMGYNSSPAISFLLSLFNVRLGWWYGNPRKDTWERKNPKNSLITFLNEVAGNTNANHDYIYLSDGGHFDNLGLYEMILRRCHCIVVSDAGADQAFAFDDLGMAIRKIRIDFGVRITFEEMPIFPRPEPFSDKTRYCSVGTIHYSEVDGGDPKTVDGKLLYFKPTFYGIHEPKDVYNYARSNETFPHQSTGDQWFSESQFESYRALGEFSVGQIIPRGATPPGSICDLLDRASDYVKREEAKADAVANLKGLQPDEVTG